MNGVDRRQDLSETLVLEPPVADRLLPSQGTFRRPGHRSRDKPPDAAGLRRSRGGVRRVTSMKCGAAAWTERRGLSSSDAGRFGRAGGVSRVRPRCTGGARVSDGGPFHPSASVPMKDELAIPLMVARRAGECRTNPQKILPCSQDTTLGQTHWKSEPNGLDPYCVPER